MTTPATLVPPPLRAIPPDADGARPLACARSNAPFRHSARCGWRAYVGVRQKQRAIPPFRPRGGRPLGRGRPMLLGALVVRRNARRRDSGPVFGACGPALRAARLRLARRALPS